MPSNDVSVVLVHGAWADGSSSGEGHPSAGSAGLQGGGGAVAADFVPRRRDSARPNPGTGEGPIVLVGHAYAGAVIGATRNERVRALVYVAALAPDEGETVADVFYRAANRIRRRPRSRPTIMGDLLAEAAFAAAFAQHASAEEQALLASVQRPISSACIRRAGRTGRSGRIALAGFSWPSRIA